MPERFDLGGAAFHLVVDSAKFGPALAQAEQQARASSAKIAAALAGTSSAGGVGTGPAASLQAAADAAKQAAASISQATNEVKKFGAAKASVSLTVDARGGDEAIARVAAELAGLVRRR